MCYDCHLWNTGINFIARLFYIHFIMLEYLNTESVEQINKQERMNFAIYSHVVRKKKWVRGKILEPVAAFFTHSCFFI